MCRRVALSTMGRTGRAPGPRPPIQLVVGLFARPGWREAALGRSSLLLPVDDAEHQLQVLSDRAFPCGAATPRLRERGTARGRREPPCPSCACAFPAPGRFPHSRRERPAPPRGSRPSLPPTSARTSARKASMRWSDQLVNSPARSPLAPLRSLERIARTVLLCRSATPNDA